METRLNVFLGRFLPSFLTFYFIHVKALYGFTTIYMFEFHFLLSPADDYRAIHIEARLGEFLFRGLRARKLRSVSISTRCHFNAIGIAFREAVRKFCHAGDQS